MSTDFTTRIIEAAAIVVPILAIAASILILSARDEQAAIVIAAPPQAPAAIVAPDGNSAAVDAVVSGIHGNRGSNATGAGQEAKPTTKPTRESEPASPSGDSPIVSVRRGDRIEVFDAPGGEPVAEIGDETEFGSPSVFSVQRRVGYWLGVSTPLVANGELGWIRADPTKLRGAYIDYSIVVDLSARWAKLYDSASVVRSWPVTVGAAGSETPTGRFAVTDTFRGNLNPAYGCCAVAISATQPDLPSDWLGGNRIAIHGTDEPLGLASSHGCIRSADGDVDALVSLVPLGAPVKIKP